MAALNLNLDLIGDVAAEAPTSAALLRTAGYPHISRTVMAALLIVRSAVLDRLTARDILRWWKDHDSHVHACQDEEDYALVQWADSAVEMVTDEQDARAHAQGIDLWKLHRQLEGDPRMHKAVWAYLGIDAEGHRVTPVKSMREAARIAGLGDNSHSRVSKALAALGITTEMRNRFWAAASSGADEGGDGGEEWEVAGFSVTRGGKAQGNVDASKRGLITAQPWYAPALRSGLANVTLRELADIAVRAVSYDTPENRSALQALMGEARTRALADPRAFHAEFDLALMRFNEAPEGRRAGEIDVEAQQQDEPMPAELH